MSMRVRITLLAALVSVTAVLPATAQAEFGLRSGPEGFAVSAVNADGTPDTQAGSHPFAFVTTLNFNQTTSSRNGASIPDENVRDIHVGFPAGLVGNPTPFAKCTQAQFVTPPPSAAYPGTDLCPDASAIGIVELELPSDGGSGPTILPVFNLVPSPGVPAEFGFNFARVPVILTPHLRADGTYGLTVDSMNTSEALQISGSRVTIWGSPYAAAHDEERGSCLFSTQTERPCHINEAEAAYLTLPANCESEQRSTATIDSWQSPASYLTDGEPNLLDPNWKTALSEPLNLEGCNKVPFTPTVSARSTTTTPDASSGFDLNIEFDNEGLINPEGVSQSELEKTVVTLPAGFTINPSEGAGLEACAQQTYESIWLHSSAECPEGSKIGEVEIVSPLVEEAIDGSLYVARQNENPFHTLLAFYIVARNAQLGLVIKQAVDVHLDPVTGQITATVEDIPQLPFTVFHLHFTQGATSPLVSPPSCGQYTLEANLYPWSNPQAPLRDTSTFVVSGGPHGEACPSAGTPPFSPEVVSGTEDNAAGSFSPFYLRIGRHDSEQEITKFSTTLPPGLTGDLTGIPFCPDADVEAARTVSGAKEIEHPSCPAASEIGHTVVEAGVGAVLAQTPGKIYLAGPYNGAPLSIVSITSAKVGPFDLGTVVIRFALDINPLTAQVEVSGAQSDPIPHILDGIVVHVRDIRVYMDRSQFIENPTSCEPMTITNAITGAGADYADPADQDTVDVGTRFQAAACASLAFKPTFTASTSGKTSRKAGASLHVQIAYPQAPAGTQSNIHEVKVELPIALPSRLSTLQKACTAKQFDANPASCPAESIVGHAKAVTPILPVPLEGPAYFVSNGTAKFPELVLVLQGYGITIDLHGETFISKKGITSSTFSTVPDQPVTAFELTLPEGPKSALAANGDLCKKALEMPTLMIGQNGVEDRQTTRIEATGCSKSITIDSHKSQGKTLKLRVTVTAAGKLTASGKGLSKASGKATGRETLTLTLKAKKGAAPGTVKVIFKPTAKGAKKQTKTLSLKKATKGHRKNMRR